MKRITIVCAVIAVLCCAAAPAEELETYTWPAFTDQAISSNGSVTSLTFSAQSRKLIGNWSAQIIVTGPGTITNLALEASNNGVDFSRPMLSTGARMGYIASSFATNSGAAADGKDVIQFAPPVARFYRLTASEAGIGAVTTTVTVAAQ